MKKITIVAGILSLFLFVGIVSANNSQHNPQNTGCNSNNEKNCPEPSQICGEGQHTNNPHCVAPTVINPCDGECEVTVTPSVTPTEPTATAEATITVGVTEEPTATPTATPSNMSEGSNHGDGQHTAGDGLHTAPDGLGCSTHECKEAPNGAPNTGRGGK